MAKKIKELSIILTNNCNSRCLHCNIWKISKDQKNDIKLDVIDHIPKKLKNIALTGGEPTLYKKLDQMIIEIIKKSKPKRICITSNGLLPDRWNKILETINNENPSNLKKLSIRFSYDAFEKDNDKIRGIKDSAIKMTKCIDIVKSYGIKDIGITQICSDDNINSVKKVYDYSRKNNLKYVFEIAQSSKEYYNIKISNIKNEKELISQLNYIIKRDLLSFMPSKWFRAYFYSFLFRINQNKINRPNIYPCLAGEKYRTITTEGEVLPCFFINKSYGNLFDKNEENPVLQNNINITHSVNNCKKKCWMVCTANQEIKNKPFFGMFWIIKTWLLIILYTISGQPKKSLLS